MLTAEVEGKPRRHILDHVGEPMRSQGLDALAVLPGVQGVGEVGEGVLGVYVADRSALADDGAQSPR
jgi:hypothetical protein